MNEMNEWQRMVLDKVVAERVGLPDEQVGPMFDGDWFLLLSAGLKGLEKAIALQAHPYVEDLSEVEAVEGELLRIGALTLAWLEDTYGLKLDIIERQEGA